MNPPYRDQSIKVPQTAYWSRSPTRQKRGGTDGPEWRKISHGPLVMLMLPDELRAGDCLTVRQNELANVLERKRGQRIRPGATLHGVWVVSDEGRMGSRTKATGISPAGWKIIALDMNDLVFVERDLQQFVDGLAVAEAIKGESKQPLLHIQAHQAGRHVDTHQAVHLLTPEQRPEIRRIVGNEHIAIGNRAAHD
jgi:hypothetical protein